MVALHWQKWWLVLSLVLMGWTTVVNATQHSHVLGTAQTASTQLNITQTEQPEQKIAEQEVGCHQHDHLENNHLAVMTASQQHTHTDHAKHHPQHQTELHQTKTHQTTVHTTENSDCQHLAHNAHSNQQPQSLMPLFAHSLHCNDCVDIQCLSTFTALPINSLSFDISSQIIYHDKPNSAYTGQQATAYLQDLLRPPQSLI